MLGSDWAYGWSFLGLLVGILGFALTLHLVRKSKSAAEAARAAAQQNTVQLRRTFTLTDLTSTVHIAQGIRRLQRERSWQIALERYGHLKTLLVRVREENPDLEPGQRAAIQSIITKTTTLETAIEALVSGHRADDDLVRWNRVLSQILESLESLSVSLKLKGQGPWAT